MLAYIGTYSWNIPGRLGPGKGVYRLSFDENTGRFLSAPELAAELENASYLSFRGERMYAVAELPAGNGELHGYDVLPDGALRETFAASTGGVAPCHVNIGPDYVAAANYMSGSVAYFPIRDGVPGGNVLFRNEGHGPDAARQEGPHMHSTLTGPDGRLFAADLGTDEIVVFDPTPDGLVRRFSGKAPGGFGPRHMVFSKDGRTLYCVCEMGAALCAWTYTGSELRFEGSISILPEGYDGMKSGADLLLSPDGNTLYASNRVHDSIAVVDIRDGMRLDRLYAAGGRTPRGTALTPDGRWLLVAHQDSDSLVSIDAATGGIADRTAVPVPVCVKLR